MIASLFAVVLVGQGVSPSHADRAQDLIRLQSAVSFCHHVGYAPAEGAGEVAEAAFKADLKAAGLSDARVASLTEDARRVEDNRLARALDLPSGLENDETRRIGKDYRAFVLARCAEAKASFPNAFTDSANEGRFFGGHIGLWLDYPLIEEVEFYLTSRGACATFQPAFDARGGAELLARPFSHEPAEAVGELVNHYVAAYRQGLDMGSEFEASQCTRLMRTAESALRLAWRRHFAGAPPYEPLS